MNRQRIFSIITLLALAVLAACGGGSSANNNNSPLTSGSTSANSVSLSVGPGPSDMTNPAGGYANILFASISICEPGTSNCSTIDHLLVDTGSSGLRILKSEIPSSISLPAITSSGKNVFECLPFVQSYAWGGVVKADMQMAGWGRSEATSIVITH